MSAVNLYFTQPMSSYVQRNGSIYRLSRITRSALRWATLCEDIAGFSRSFVSVLKVSARAISVAGLLTIVPRIHRTVLRIWCGVDGKGREAALLDYAYIARDVSMVVMLLLYKSPSVRLTASGSNLCIQGQRLYGLGNKYINVLARENREDNGYLLFEIMRTIVCISYLAFRALSVLLGNAVLTEVAFLSIMTARQFMHFGAHYYQEIYCPVRIPEPA